MIANVSGTITVDDELNFAEDNGFEEPSEKDDGFMSLEWDGREVAVFFEGPTSPGSHSDVEASLYVEKGGDVFAYSNELVENKGACLIIVHDLQDRHVTGGLFCTKLLGVKVNEDGNFQPLSEDPPAITIASTFDAEVRI
jgi:hypothetical protein